MFNVLPKPNILSQLGIRKTLKVVLKNTGIGNKDSDGAR